MQPSCGNLGDDRAHPLRRNFNKIITTATMKKPFIKFLIECYLFTLVIDDQKNQLTTLQEEKNVPRSSYFYSTKV